MSHEATACQHTPMPPTVTPVLLDVGEYEVLIRALNFLDASHYIAADTDAPACDVEYLTYKLTRSQARLKERFGIVDEKPCTCRGPVPEDPCGHGDTSQGCPKHDPNYEEDE